MSMTSPRLFARSLRPDLGCRPGGPPGYCDHSVDVRVELRPERPRASERGDRAVSTQTTNPQDDPMVGFGPNEWIVQDMYQRYLADPASVDPAWHDIFADYHPDGEA